MAYKFFPVENETNAFFDDAIFTINGHPRTYECMWTWTTDVNCVNACVCVYVSPQAYDAKNEASNNTFEAISLCKI